MSDQKLIEMAAALGRMEGKLDEALRSDRERINKIEKSLERQWWMSYVVTPFLLVAHAFARKFGVQI
jgi:hypothetical protein